MASPRPTILNSPSSSQAAFLASSLPPLRQCHPSALQRTNCCPVSLREGCVSACALEMGWGWGGGVEHVFPCYSRLGCKLFYRNCLPCLCLPCPGAPSEVSPLLQAVEQKRASWGSNWPHSQWGVSPRRTQLPRLKLTKARGLRGPSQFLRCHFF